MEIKWPIKWVSLEEFKKLYPSDKPPEPVEIWPVIPADTDEVARQVFREAAQELAQRHPKEV